MEALKELQSMLDDKKEGMIEFTYVELSNKILEIYKTITSLYNIDYIETEISRTSPLDYQVLSRPKKIILQLNEFELELIKKAIELNGFFNVYNCSTNDISKKFNGSLNQEIYKDYTCECNDESSYTEISIQNSIIILKINII